ncbi:MAG: hypothetical protein K5764_05630 [Prevotella sp.]|nr:hypothetical protein [Prevotella sp.]
MKKFFLVSILMGALPLTIWAQDDDLYFVPKKQTTNEVKTDRYGMPKDTYYSGSSRSVDDYNRRKSTYQIIDGDSTLSDVIDFSSEAGVYPDSATQAADDFRLTRELSRFDDFVVDSAYLEGYRAGRSDSWHSPWYYRRYGWYSYDPWYYNIYYGDPFYYGWYNPWYYDPWYDGWYYPYHRWGWNYPYAYGGWYGGWYRPYYYGGISTRPAIHRQSPRRHFGSESRRSGFGSGSGSSSRSGRASFGASRGNTHRYSASSSRTTGGYNGSGRSSSFGASRSGGSSYSSSSSSSAGSRSFGGGGGSVSSGGGSRSSGGGGGFGRHR